MTADANSAPHPYLQIVDLTSRRHSEANAQQTQKLEAIGQLTGGLAHDFDSLFDVILDNLNVLRDVLKSDDSARDQARRGACRCGTPGSRAGPGTDRCR